MLAFTCAFIGLIRPSTFKKKNGAYLSRFKIFTGLVGASAIFVIGFAITAEKQGDSSPAATAAISQPVKPLAAATSTAPSAPPKVSAEPDRPTSDEIQIADDFCQDSSKVYMQIESSFKNLQSGVSSSKKNKSPEKLVATIQSFGVRSSELEEDAGKLYPPNINSDIANTAMSEMAISVQGVARKNAEAGENLQSLFSYEQSPERSQENAKSIGAARDYFAIKYSSAVFRLFDSLGYTPNDIDSKTMCLKPGARNRSEKTSP